MISTKEIEKAFQDMENEIKYNNQFINALMVFIEVSKTFDQKVINKRFTAALKDALKDAFYIYDYSYSYRKDAIDFPIYLKEIYGQQQYFRFPLETCFTATDSGKLRINAEGFKEQCQIIRQNLVDENTRTRNDIDLAYQMMIEAAELKKKADEFNNKYSYKLKSKFKCDYMLRTW